MGRTRLLWRFESPQAADAPALYELTMSGVELVVLVQALEAAPEPWRDPELAAQLDRALRDMREYQDQGQIRDRKPLRLS